MGNNIKALRVVRGMKQDQVARDLGVKLDTYRSWEQNKRNPTGTMAIRIAEYFGVTTDTVYGTQFADPIGLQITEDEQQLIDAYRSLPPDMRAVALRVVKSMA